MYKRLLKVALVGAPNAGKSTLLNRLVESEVSCVSKKVHTTRKNMLAVFTREDAQLEFYDSPGIVTRKHLIKHRLEDSLLNDPEIATTKCDLIAVIVDASNIREQRSLNKGISNLLSNHREKESILIMNKVDLIKEKRSLLDISTRLTQGCIDGRLSKSVVFKDQIERPDLIGYKNFSQVFSISALRDDGVDELRDHLLSKATPVEAWPHRPDYLTNQHKEDIVHEIIRGKILDYVENVVPYLLKYKYLHCKYDEFGSLHVHLLIKCPSRYMVSKVLGEKGIIVSRITHESKKIISKVLSCDVKLSIVVEASIEKKVN